MKTSSDQMTINALVKSVRGQQNGPEEIPSPSRISAAD